MTDMPVLRWMLLLYGVLAVLGATVLFSAVQTRILAPWLRLNERLVGQPERSPIRSERLQRAWLLAVGALMLSTWWYLETNAAAALGATSRSPMMTLSGIREVAAAAVLFISFATFAAHAAYGVYLDIKLARFRRSDGRLTKADRWDPVHYEPGAESLLQKDRRWQRWNTAVWVGCTLGAAVLAHLIRP